MTESTSLTDTRVALVGKFAAMPKRTAAETVRGRGGTVVQNADAADVVVVGEDDLPLVSSPDDEGLHGLLDESALAAAAAGKLEVIGERELWRRLDLLGEQDRVGRLCTAQMLAGLLDVPVSTIRRWRRKGLIQPVREVHKLEYYDFQQVATARRLAELLASGISPKRIESQLHRLRDLLPDMDRPLAQLSIIVEGRDLLLRQGEGLIDAGGQLRFDFEATEPDESAPHETAPRTIAFASIFAGVEQPPEVQPLCSPHELADLAAELEDQGDLHAAEDALRAALAAGGPSAELNFQLAELLYRQGHLPAARERYFAAIEIDEDYVEARANLGCVLMELDQPDLAEAAFAGALRFHPDYADVHYHFARLLNDIGRRVDAAVHWKTFLDLSPDSPWADQAAAELANPAD